MVGSANSSNSVRLVEVARDHGARAAHLVDDATAIDEAWLDGVTTVGLSSGASVPEVLVTDVLAWLAERGYGEVEEVDAAEEKQSFALPRGAAPPRRRRLASRRRRCGTPLPVGRSKDVSRGRRCHAGGARPARRPEQS